ncbi:MAG: hypothetical protein K5885_07085 [Bacteroidales bacterium]|jgi:hypothetical protein|nr:hypothetical protein [Bacteroidales bacterium]MCR4873295.1 hypothetical protein [Bacteroidales bacterium]
MKRFALFMLLAMMWMAAGAQNWYQFGFRVSTQVPLVRAYSNEDYLENLRTPHFGAYFRAGKYVYGEIGIGYQYFKGRFVVNLHNGETMNDLVETRYLVIPIKAVGDVPITKKIAFMPHLGILYQPLLKVTDNILGYSKENIENQWVMLTTGFDFRFSFITIGADYRYSFQHFFQNKEGRRPQYAGITVGVIF